MKKTILILCLGSFFAGCATWSGIKKDSSNAWDSTKKGTSKAYKSVKKSIHEATAQ